MKRIRFSTAFALILSCFLLQQVLGQTPKSTAGPAPDHITLSWTGDPATTMTVTWRTDSTVNSGIVQYQEGKKLAGAAPKVEARAREFKTDLGSLRIFAASLTNLTPNTAYSYRVGDGARWSETLSFKTADPKAKSFKFLVFGDSQSPATGSDPYGIWRTTVHNAFKANPDAAFMVNVGDLVDYGQEEAHWNAWFAASKGVIDAIPAMMLAGNHESYGMRQIGKPAFFAAQFSLPPNGPALLKNQAYFFNYGPLHLVALDSQWQEQRKFGDILSMQQSWLESNLSTSDAEWKIAFFHRSPYGVKPDRNESEVREAFCPILERNRVALAFTAHDHGIKRTPPMKGNAPAEDPSQGTVYYVTGRSGIKTYPDIKAMEHSAFFYDPKEQPNYLVVEGTDLKITVTAILQDGTVVDTYTIEKPKISR